MAFKDQLKAELEYESKATREMLSRLPQDKLTWKPHSKSMTLGELSFHIAEIPEWFYETVVNEEYDFSKNDYKAHQPKTTSEVVEAFDKNLKRAIECVKDSDDDYLMKNWTLRDGETIFFEMPRMSVLKSFVFNHLIHHRGQLSVYLRMNDVPLPSVYGPTADEQGM